MVTAADTTRALRKHVFPLLRSAGFDDWTTRRAWRHSNDRIDHIEFRSFNGYYADKFEASTASISVWIGISLPFLSYAFEAPDGPKGKRPDEAQMRIRGELYPSTDYVGPVSTQPGIEGIWIVRTHEEAEAASRDIARVIENVGLPRLSETWSAEVLLERMLNEGGEISLKSDDFPGRFWLDVGPSDTPIRNVAISDLAALLGRFSLAADHLERSRWCRNPLTEELYMFLDPAEDEQTRALIAEYQSMR